LAAIVACSPKDPQNPNFVVASFKGGKITRAELNAKESEFIGRYGGKLEELKPEQAAALDWKVTDGLVTEKIIAAKTAKIKDKIQPAVDVEIAEAQKQVGGAEELTKRLAEAGMTERDLAERIAQREAVRYLVRQEKDAPTPTTEAEAREFYNNNPQYFTEEEVYSLRYIAIPVPPDASAADKKKIQAKAAAAHKRVTGGEDFEKVAKEHDPENPRAGATQEVPASRFSPEFGKVVKAVKPGNFGAVQEMGPTLLIFQVVEFKPAKTAAFDEVKHALIQRLDVQKEEPFVRQLVEKLRADAKVQINLADPAKEPASQPSGVAAPAEAPAEPAQK
jgi:peptidyl-prolyl cis-trans isomerase C